MNHGSPLRDTVEQWRRELSKSPEVIMSAFTVCQLVLPTWGWLHFRAKFSGLPGLQRRHVEHDVVYNITRNVSQIIKESRHKTHQSTRSRRWLLSRAKCPRLKCDALSEQIESMIMQMEHAEAGAVKAAERDKTGGSPPFPRQSVCNQSGGSLINVPPVAVKDHCLDIVKSKRVAFFNGLKRMTPKTDEEASEISTVLIAMDVIFRQFCHDIDTARDVQDPSPGRAGPSRLCLGGAWRYDFMPSDDEDIVGDTDLRTRRSFLAQTDPRRPEFRRVCTSL